MKTAIVIPTRTGALLEGCLGALKMTTEGIDSGETGVFIVANGDDAERKELDVLVRTFRGALPQGAVVVAVPDDQGPWYGNLCHAGALRARDHGATEIVFLNDDTYPTTRWLSDLRQDMESAFVMGVQPGLLGARGNHVSGPQNIFDLTEVAMRQKVYAAELEKLLSPNPVAFVYPRIVTFCAMALTEVYFQVGGFDLELPAHNCSDDILSYRMLKAGRHNYVSGAFVAHLGSRTVARATGPEDMDAARARYEADLAAGMAYLKEKYPDYGSLAETELRRQIHTVRGGRR